MQTWQGVTPAGWTVLVEPDPIPEAVTEGGIVIAETYREQHQQAQTTGTLRATGPLAWADRGDGGPWAVHGDRVLYDKYTGMAVAGEDGKEYRLINDTEIKAVIAPGIEMNQLQRRVKYER